MTTTVEGPPPPSPSAHTSLASLPGARYIESHERDSHMRQYSTATSTSSTGRHRSASPRMTKETVGGRKKEFLRNTAGRIRKNSLRHVKDSTEVLRERSLRSQCTDTLSEGSSGGREGRSFTVGNVGNGMIYLRPMVRPATQRSQQPFTFPSNEPLSNARPKTGGPGQGIPKEIARNSIWSSSEISESKPRNIFEQLHNHEARQGSSSHSPKIKNKRAHSFSTIGDDHSLTVDPKSGTLKIVINRPTSRRPSSADEPTIPTIEVPIPHYRLGSPRFSTQGTAMLRSSIYTRTSGTDNNFRSSMLSMGGYDALFPYSPDRNRNNDCRYSLNGLNSLRLQPGPMEGVPRRSTVLPLAVFTRSKEPITPEIFDALAQGLNDPSVARFSPTTGELTAGTPARIIAQITSDSVMDYELVSDFFLTVRSYLSTDDLLALLFSRLKWAINRFESDGRIVRIRTFAAMRHWILNYFLDDFVLHRALRIQFCEKLNSLFKEVSQRTEGGTSDLKILLDLKKCWNGRCALYWDSPSFSLDANPAADLLPGGVAGSRNSDLNSLSDLRQQVQEEPEEMDDAENAEAADQIQDGLGTWFGDFDNPPIERSGHGRDASMDSTYMPISPMSERSVQPLSCSLPGKNLKRTWPSIYKTSGPRPVPLSSFTPTSLAAGRKRPIHQHKRSGSFSDSVRDDRAPLPASKVMTQNVPIVYAFPEEGSIIRGTVFPPVDPYIDLIVPTSPTSPPTIQEPSRIRSTPNLEATDRSASSSPGTKIFGSIRRALSSRHSPGSSHDRHDANMASTPGTAKSLALPSHVTFSFGAPISRKAEPSIQHQSRLDVLSAEVSEAYRKILQAHNQIQEDEGDLDSAQGQPSASGTRTPQPLAPIRRIPSQVTQGSQSIVIVDDTGLDLPTMSGALQLGPSSVSSPQSTLSPRPMHPLRASCLSRRRSFDGERSYPPSSSGKRSVSLDRLRRSGTFNNTIERHSKSTAAKTFSRSASSRNQDSFSWVGKESFSYNSSNRMSLRKYASLHSSLNRQTLARSLNSETFSSPGALNPESSTGQPPARMLRRRPGGDLRGVQNVHDLEPNERPASGASLTACSESILESTMYMAVNRNVGAPQGASPQQSFLLDNDVTMSLLETHSSQPAMRPSFEATVAGFATIPDDDDGGVESALLKLEGKYLPKPKSPPITKDQDTVSRSDNGTTPIPRSSNTLHAPSLPNSSGIEITETELRTSFLLGSEDGDDQGNEQQLGHASSVFGLPTQSVAGSEDSYNSVPLLERLSNACASSHERVSHWVGTDELPNGKVEDGRNANAQESNSSHPSIDVVVETASMRDIPPGATFPSAPSRAHSFLLDEDENLSDLSSEISAELVDAEEANEGESSLPGPSPLSALPVPSCHPLRHPPSPPGNLEIPKSATPPQDPMMYQNKPPTPEPSPTNRMDSRDFRFLNHSAQPSDSIHQIIANAPDPLQTNPHLPFILAYDSELLAQQFTIIEKDALNEVEWRELVDMRWHHTPPSALNWVEFLTDHDPKGVGIVSARFNLMVKWALSTIMLTENAYERARTIVKYIHIASQARKMHNYATMLQITIALTAYDCARLKQTWQLVPAKEKQILREMEALAQPTRNFYRLREEMETGDLDEGCIPFVGLYVHDLTYNAQKPAQIASTRDGEPLVNFERFRTTATIVKSLLRLIDASAKYSYHPIDGAIQRCLWMAALPDEKIRILSRQLE
ncbi:MAG: Guanine nucleotide exchange factor lte1 [Cirrosporium novae-zelandiae]|nr:MAG: Guanine nucleotide exchange factor lte1 [Cirrosporium novae-zelandiae]